LNSKDNEVKNNSASKKEKTNTENEEKSILPNQALLDEVTKLLLSLRKNLESNKNFNGVVKDIDKIVNELSKGKADFPKISAVIQSLKDIVKFTELKDKKSLETTLKEIEKFTLTKVNGNNNNIANNNIANNNIASNDIARNDITRNDITRRGQDKKSLNEVKDSSKTLKTNNDEVLNRSLELKSLELKSSELKNSDPRRDAIRSKEIDKSFSRIKVFNFKGNEETFSKVNNDVLESNLSNQQHRSIKRPVFKQKANLEQLSQKHISENNIQSDKKVELSILNSTPVEFSKREEIAPKYTKGPSFFNYLKSDITSQLNQLSGLMVINLRNNVNEMKMTLFPPELGKLFVKFESTSDGRIVGNIVVSTKEAFTLFEEHLQTIKDNLQNQGFQFVDINLSMSNNGFGDPNNRYDYIDEGSKFSFGISYVENNYNDSSSGKLKSLSDDSLVNLYA
jgi:flagellar hook-length control protein FliK